MNASRPARSLRRRVAAWIYTGIAIPSLVLGTIYLFRPTFMPYHAVALGKEWAELEPATQVLIKALMEVAGGGWLALGTLMLLLVAFPIRRGERWARWAAPLRGIDRSSPSETSTRQRGPHSAGPASRSHLNPRPPFARRLPPFSTVGAPYERPECPRPPQSGRQRCARRRPRRSRSARLQLQTYS